MTVADAKALKPEIYTWTFPGAPIRISLHLDVVGRLRKEVADGFHRAPQPLQAGGILLGKKTSRSNRVEILDFRSVEFGEIHDSSSPFNGYAVEKLKLLIDEAERSHDQLSVVGCYRSHFGGNLQLNEQDLSLMRGCFSDPSNVFLLIRQTEKGSADAGFFFWEDGQINGDFSFMDFPFDEDLLAEMPHPMPDPPAAAARTPVESMAFAKPVVPAASPGSGGSSAAATKLYRRMLWILVACAALIAIAAAGYRFAQSPPPPNAFTITDSVGLQVERHGADLRVSWNRNGPLVENARVGILTIKDGQGEQTLYLDLPQLRTGSVLYSPVTDKIHFRLEVFTSDGKTASEAVLAVMGRQPAHGQTASQPVAPPVIAPVRQPAPNPVATHVQTAKKDGAPALVMPAVNPPAVSQQEAKPFIPPVSPDRSGETARTIYIDPPADQPISSVASGGVVLPAALPAQPQWVSPPPPRPPAVTAAQPEEVKPPQVPAPVISQTRTAVAEKAPVDEVFVPAAPLRKVNPVIDPTLKFMLSRETIVDVKVTIDAQGKVVKAEPVNRDGSIAGFIATASVNAARLWTFRPARRGDRNLPSDMVVQFKFNPVR